MRKLGGFNDLSVTGCCIQFHFMILSDPLRLVVTASTCYRPAEFGNIVPGVLAPVLAMTHGISIAWHSVFKSGEQ